MKIFVVFSMLAFSSSVSFAKTFIEVTEPNFTAEKIEFNSVTNSYVVVNPKYFVNALEAYKIDWDGTISSDGPHTAKHLCTFLGMTGGKVISYTSSIWSHECKKTITIQKDGLYGPTDERDYRNGCRMIDFLECSPR
jgi:hypothetical protein